MSIEIIQQTVGYGYDEHEEHVARCKISIDHTLGETWAQVEEKAIQTQRAIDLYVRDRSNGLAHRVGDDHHDALYVDERGIVQYMNLQNGDGTLAGDQYHEGGYEFVKTDPETDMVDDETLRQAEEHRAAEALFRKAQAEEAKRGVVLIS